MKSNVVPEGLSKSELQSVLSQLKTYRIFRKKLGKRGAAVFATERSNEKTLRIEHFPSFVQKDVEDVLVATFGKNYAEGYRTVWKENPSLSGGIRVFF